ncbi:uncharacterized protein PAC_14830 [Phialocephala subalpina]|uniref:Zn(2)-C6 fungal-type domain-containing protein n=1 Tax=Phialocephala subalpina TaxID=576137 RepID=A0A1L7XIR6_9HELO|nr:uncharacterized protein PAC_14830 [Phialocephala subalpina]
MEIKEIPEKGVQLEGAKKKQRSQAKVKTGCRTCKARRVKCDEGRPVCQRCIKWGGPSSCDGYNDIPTKAPATTPRMLLPNPRPLCRTPTVRRFGNDEEYRFFRRFCTDTSAQLTGARGSELWNRVVLQASEMEPCVRHAVMAIGALDFNRLSHGGTDLESIHREFTFLEYGALTAVGLINASSWSRKLNFKERRGREFAYKEYGKAISSLKKAVMEKRSHITTRLLACILFVCFESYHGNNESAAAQTYAGIEMMERYSRQRSEWTPSLKTLRPPPIDPEIVEAFAMLEIQAISWTNESRPDRKLERRYASGEVIEEIPKEFKSLKHAGFMLSMLVLRANHLRYKGSVAPYVSPGMNDPGHTEYLPVYHVSPEHSELCNILNRIQQWNLAFAPLLRKSGIQEGRNYRREALLLKMHCLSTYVWTASAAPLAEMWFRRCTSELTEIVSLARVLINETKIRNECSPLDLRILLPLMIVGWYYRHRASRKEVISMFDVLPKREGTWDAGMIARIMEWMVEIEEGGLTDEEYVPEDAISNVTILKIDVPSRTVYVELIQGVRGQGEKTAMKSKTMNW